MLCRARDLQKPVQPSSGYPLTFAVSRGCITELSGPAALDVLCRLLREVQQRSAQRSSAHGSARRGGAAGALRVVWIMTHQSLPFAPDLAANGVAVRDIAFVFTPHPVAAAQAAEQCLRSNGVDLVILDFAEPAAGLCATAGHTHPRERMREIDNAVLGRLLRLCRRSHAALLAITERSGDLAGSLVFTRLVAERRRSSSAAAAGANANSTAGGDANAGANAGAGGRFVSSLKLVKTKTGRQNAAYREVLHGPYGML